MDIYFFAYIAPNLKITLRRAYIGEDIESWIGREDITEKWIISKIRDGDVSIICPQSLEEGFEKAKEDCHLQSRRLGSLAIFRGIDSTKLPVWEIWYNDEK